jgi:uncharacterized membrane protein
MPRQRAESSVTLRPVDFAQPLQWLRLGWQDFRRAPGIGLFYGLCFMAMGWALLAMFEYSPAYVLALSGGFLLVGPFCAWACTASARSWKTAKSPPSWIRCWPGARARASWASSAWCCWCWKCCGRAAPWWCSPSPFDGVPDFKGSLAALASPENIVFTIVWFCLGLLFASLIYSISVVSMPMILHRRTDAITAGLTSMRLVLSQTAVMMCWAAVIAGLVLLALLPWFAGLLVIGPVLGHASWHAYRATVAD